MSFVLLIFWVIIMSCTQQKNKVEKVDFPKVPEKHSSDINLKNIPEAQQELASRTDFDRTVLSYDTTTLITTDSIPLRLMHELDRYNRIPPYKMIAGRKMKRNGIGYEYKDKEWHIKTQYPGVVGYFPRSWGDYIKKIEYYDQDRQLLRTLDFDKLTPYSSNSFKNITPGGFNFELMELDEGFETENYIEEAVALKEDRNIILLNNNNWIVANYQLLALGEFNRVIGYESTLVVYNELGEIQFSEKLPFSVGKSFVSTDYKYLVYRPRRANYMPQSNRVKGELFIVDLTQKKLIYKQLFKNERIKCAGFVESIIENVLTCTFKTPNDVDKSDQYHFIIDLPKRAIFSIDKKSRKIPNGNYKDYTKPLLLTNEYTYKEF